MKHELQINYKLSIDHELQIIHYQLITNYKLSIDHELQIIMSHELQVNNES
jgi:hypothetical protein